ncbi:MAG: S1 family peptidase [Myxococcaceae bacterium]
MGRWTWALAAVALVACAPAGDELLEAEGQQPAVGRNAIVGGIVDNGDPEVFMLAMQYDNNTQSGCTATLIAPRTLLTAAHCVDPRIGNATSVQIWAMNKTDMSTAGYSDLIHVTETRMHGSWNPAVGLEHDIAVALLERAPAVSAPKPWNSASVSTYGGRALRAVGYGTTGASGAGSGIKRQVALTFRQLSSTHIYLGDMVGKGVCHGDSGGPSFHTFSDGVERQVGIHSYTTGPDCVDGADIRVDAYTGFVNQWLADKEAPQCSRDGKCKAGCTPPDIDCLCQGDGVCNPQCPVLTDDPDCPKDCVANGVCSLQPCPVPDADCVAEGGACTSELQCKGRQCISDGQHPAFYCSRTCAVSTECPPGLSCPTGGGVCRYPSLPLIEAGGGCTPGTNVCSGTGFVCSGAPGSATTCVKGCAVTADCPTPQTCESGQNSFKYCREPVKPLIYLTRARTEGAAAASCAQAGGAPLGLALWLLAALLGRRRSPARG